MLVGVLLLSAILYYRAVKIQRFLEPALAISEPRTKFSQGVRNLLTREFGPREIEGIRFRGGSIMVDQSLLLAGAHPGPRSELAVLKKLSRFFLAALGDEDLRKYISIVMVNARLPQTDNAALNAEMRYKAQDRAVLILNTLFSLEPMLEKRYAQYFVSTARVFAGSEKELDQIEFRIIPTEQLHIEVLQRLEQYAY
jgi:hypothetical protein